MNYTQRKNTSTVVSEESLDTMPEPLKAIECVRRKDYDGARSANKNGRVVFDAESVTYNIKIGQSDEGLG